MAQMPATAPAVHLFADHAERTVLTGRHGLVQRCPETRPAGTAVELGGRGKQWQIATGTDERAIAVLVVQRAAVGSFGALFAKDFVLFIAQKSVPFAVAVGHFEYLRCAGFTDQGRACGKLRQQADRQGCHPQPAARYKKLPS
ncbi:hypothetical protein D9M73_174210 [compost metagenome]